MKCHLVLEAYYRPWVMGKICNRFGEELRALGHEVSIGDSARPGADINHFMLYLDRPPAGLQFSTVGVTHVDDSDKVKLAQAAAQVTDLAICMSSMTARQLLDAGVDRSKVCYVQPAVDEGLAPRRIVIGITTKLYEDGRKRESLLERLAQEIDLSAFRFEIMGTGWDRLGGLLRHAGAEVSVDEGANNLDDDYRKIRERVPLFDYYLYTGLDEGSLGTLDALAAGVKTIITPQGFHVDLPHGITHPFWTYDELRAVFESIRDERDARIRAVRHLTWRAYAMKHVLIWRTLLEGRREELPRLLGQESLDPLGGFSECMNQHRADLRRRLIFRSITHLYWPRALGRLTKLVPEPVRKYWIGR